jgi:small subunit ribosomal protein S1
MTQDPSSESVPQSLDDSYWAALFQQENAEVLPRRESSFDQLWIDIGNLIEQGSDGADGSKPAVNRQNPWQVAHELCAADQVVELPVTGSNKGGLLVQWNGLQGFVPASQLIEFPQFHIEAQRIRTLRQWVDRHLKLKIIEVNQHANRLILSERATLVKADERARMLTNIRPDDILEGQVTNLTQFGAFVDLGGVEGLAHISELSWSRVVHPSDVLTPGQTVLVLVLNVDQDKERVALSLKRLRPNPWQDIESRYQPGQIVEGVVSKVVSFGAFVLLEDELEGLIHISELAEGTFFHPRNIVQHGDSVVAEVVEVDGEAKRLALSLRRDRS